MVSYTVSISFDGVAIHHVNCHAILKMEVAGHRAAHTFIHGCPSSIKHACVCICVCVCVRVPSALVLRRLKANKGHANSVNSLHLGCLSLILCVRVCTHVCANIEECVYVKYGCMLIRSHMDM